MFLKIVKPFSRRRFRRRTRAKSYVRRPRRIRTRVVYRVPEYLRRQLTSAKRRASGYRRKLNNILASMANEEDPKFSPMDTGMKEKTFAQLQAEAITGYSQTVDAQGNKRRLVDAVEPEEGL